MPRRRKSASPLRASGGSASPRAARRSVSYCGSSEGRRLHRPDARVPHRRVFFPATARSIVRGWTSSPKCLPNAASPTRAHESARPRRVLVDKRQDVAAELVGTAWTSLLGHQPGDAGFGEVRLGSDSTSAATRRTPRWPPLTDACSTETRRSISYLTCTTSRGSKNSWSRNFGSRTFSGAGFKRALFEEGPELGVHALGSHGDGNRLSS